MSYPRRLRFQTTTHEFDLVMPDCDTMSVRVLSLTDFTKRKAYQTTITPATQDLSGLSIGAIFDYLSLLKDELNDELSQRIAILETEARKFKLRILFAQNKGENQKMWDFQMTEVSLQPEEWWQIMDDRRTREIKEIFYSLETEKQQMAAEQQRIKQAMKDRDEEYQHVFGRLFKEILDRLDEHKKHRNHKKHRDHKKYRRDSRERDSREKKTVKKQKLSEQPSKGMDSSSVQELPAVVNKSTEVIEIDRQGFSRGQACLKFTPFAPAKPPEQKPSKRQKRARKTVQQQKVADHMEPCPLEEIMNRAEDIPSFSEPVCNNEDTETRDEFNQKFNGLNRYQRRKDQGKLVALFNPSPARPTLPRLMDNTQIIHIPISFLTDLDSCQHFETCGNIIRKKSGLNYQHMIFDCPVTDQGRYSITMRILESKRLYIWFGVVDARQRKKDLLYNEAGTICYSYRTGIVVTSNKWSKQKTGRLKPGQTVRMEIDREKLSITWHVSDGRVAIADIFKNMRKMALLPYFQMLDVGDTVEFQHDVL